jgi:ribosomal protein S18 acetylase RimI-like enzyme
MTAPRPARAEDAPAIVRVVDAAYRGYIPRIGKPPGPMLDDYPARIAAGQAWVLDRDGQIAAALVLEAEPDGFVLDNIAVDPAHQGKGIGRALIAFAEARAFAAGYREISLYTNAAMVENVALYTRLGFREVRRGEANGFQRVWMAKPLGGAAEVGPPSA